MALKIEEPFDIITSSEEDFEAWLSSASEHEVDVVLRQHGIDPEMSWEWFREKMFNKYRVILPEIHRKKNAKA